MTRQRALLLALALLAGAATSIWVISRGDDNGGQVAAGETNAVTEPQGPPLTAPPGEPVDVEPLPPVGVGDRSDFGNGLVATVVEVESVEAGIGAPGDTAGPAVAIHLELRNEADQAVDLGGIAVNATDAEGTPASPNRGAPAEQLTGLLAPGATSTGVYVFRVDGSPDGLVIDVHHNASPNIVLVET
jgi:hypothetical protein